MLGQGRVYYVDWLPDETTLAVMGTVGVWLYDTQMSNPLPELVDIPFGRSADVALSPDGSVLATIYHGTSVKLWDIHTSTELVTLKGSTNLIQKLVFSHDGRYLAAGDAFGIIRLWDIESQLEIAVLNGNDDRLITSLAFSSDNTLLVASSGYRTVRVWQIPSGEELKIFENFASGSEIMGVSFGTDGATLAAWMRGSAHMVRLWDMHGNRILNLNTFEKTCLMDLNSFLGY